MGLGTSDQGKVIAAGFTLFRLEVGGKQIKTTRLPGCWRLYGNYRTQRECRMKWDFLMSNDMHIRG